MVLYVLVKTTNYYYDTVPTVPHEGGTYDYTVLLVNDKL